MLQCPQNYREKVFSFSSIKDKWIFQRVTKSFRAEISNTRMPEQISWILPLQEWVTLCGGAFIILEIHTCQLSHPQFSPPSLESNTD